MMISWMHIGLQKLLKLNLREVTVSKTVELPSNTVAALKNAYDSDDREALKTLVISLREAQWPLRSIGTPLGVSRSTVQFWERSARPGVRVEVPYSPRAVETAGVKTVRRRPEMSEETKNRLGELSKQAQQVRSLTPQDSPLRKASEELDRLIEMYLYRMVPITDIAKAMGVTHRAVAARIERRNET